MKTFAIHSVGLDTVLNKSTHSLMILFFKILHTSFCSQKHQHQHAHNDAVCIPSLQQMQEDTNFRFLPEHLILQFNRFA